MIIITEHNFQLIDEIPRVVDPENEPDVVFYPSILNKKTITEILNIVSYLKYNKKHQVWFADNSKWVYEADLPAQFFPNIIDLIRSDVQHLGGEIFNSCLVIKYNRYDPDRYSSVNFNKNIKSMLDKNYISASVFIGSGGLLKFTPKRSSRSDIRSDIRSDLDVPSGSILLQLGQFHQYWDMKVFNEGKKSTAIYQLLFRRVYPPEKFTKVCDISDITHSQPKLRKSKRIKIPKQLSLIYLKSKFRKQFRRIIRKGLKPLHEYPNGTQCVLTNGINEMYKYIRLGNLIGTGDWGNVYTACLRKDILCRREFALKMSRITEGDLSDPYTETSSAWYELWMLKDIFKPLVEQSICPNLPLFIDTFLCSSCDFILRKKAKSHPCIINIMELASGDMKDYFLHSNITDEKIYSALFQIMAGLHAIQMNGQILNNDIKAKNILFYDVKPGGYWHYRLRNTDFYIPNHGKMFILNDFGVSNLYDPNFQLFPNKHRNTFNLGARYAINMNEKFYPIEAKVEHTRSGMQKTGMIKWISGNTVNETSHGAMYKIDRDTGQVFTSRTILTEKQKSYLFRRGITTNPKTWDFFEHPFIIPPFEFYNDVQDVLRTIVGGKRTTQRGNHTVYESISEQIRNSIRPYMGSAENSKVKEFSLETYHVLAGSFILKFFTEAHSYKKRPKGKKLGYYDMDKCLNFKKY